MKIKIATRRIIRKLESYVWLGDNVISNFFFACIFGEYILCVYTLLVFFNEKIQGDIGFDSLSLLPLSKYKSEEKSVENAEYGNLICQSKR